MLGLILLLAAGPITVDPAAHRVTITAKATEVTADTTLEFAFVGPDSDRGYEALFVTDAKIADIAKAFDEAGIPRGRAITPAGCRFWPVGKHLTLTPSIWDYVTDTQTNSQPAVVTAGANGGRGERLPVVYTAGTRDANDVPVATTNMPSSLMAFYSLDQSLLLLDDAIDQSSVYGRFKSNGKVKAGKNYTFTFAWDGVHGTESRVLKLGPGKIKEAITSLKGAKSDLDIMPDFSSDLTVAEAKSAAMALAVIDSRSIKVNGFVSGQIFYRGYLPDVNWRTRAKRLTQPLEVRMNPTNVTYTVIHENWNVEGIDPELTPKEVALKDVATTFKGNACLFYVGKDEKLARIYARMKELPKTIVNWYVFID